MDKLWIAGLIILLNSSLAWSENLNVVVVGLFNGQAVLQIDKKQRLLKVGNTSPEGVKLISANSAKAVLEIDGVRKTFQLGQHISSSFSSTTAQAEVDIWQTDGMFSSAGSINGYSVDFLVDTGASLIALNATTATRLNLDYENARKIVVKTASKTEIARQITLDTVQLGGITLHNVQAMIMGGEQPERALLGMSFLNHVEMVRTGEKMNLKQKY